MADAKISALTAYTTPISTDVLPVVDVTTVETKKVTLANLGLIDGWIPASESWAYASASTITVPSGAASKYGIGDRIKWTQTSVKYGVIVAVADTTLTIAVNTDYTVADAAISANFYSHQETPVGYPLVFNYTPTFGGFSSNPTVAAAWFYVTGNMCFVYVRTSQDGTSNATSFTITTPIAASATSAQEAILLSIFTDNGSRGGPGFVDVSGTTMTLYKSGALTTWTATGTKAVEGIGGWYRI